MRAAPYLHSLALILLVATAAPAAACVGDCNDDDRVLVNELVTMVNVALETTPLTACAAGDADQNGAIAVDEILAGVNHALAGCTATTPLAPCSGAALTSCGAACGSDSGQGCCTLTTPNGCFNPNDGSIAFTPCGTQPSAACLLPGGPTPTATQPSGPTATASPTPTGPTPTPISGAGTQVTIVNQTAAATTVYVNFGADSQITQSDWAAFCSGSGLSCQFPLGANASQALPNPSGKYLNFTTAFGSPVGCGATKAEVNVNNPSWYDILDVSLVDGYSNDVAIIATPTGGGQAVQLGPPNGESGNETVFGVYPYGCDVCVARCSPPCGIAKSDPLLGCNSSCDNCQSNGVDGCKAGTQSNPAVPCQFQGPTLGGGGQTVQVVLMP